MIPAKEFSNVQKCFWGKKICERSLKLYWSQLISAAKVHTNTSRIFACTGSKVRVKCRWSSWSTSSWTLTDELAWVFWTGEGPDCTFIFWTDQSWVKIIGFRDEINNHSNIYSNGKRCIILQTQSLCRNKESRKMQKCRKMQNCRTLGRKPEAQKSVSPATKVQPRKRQWASETMSQWRT